MGQTNRRMKKFEITIERNPGKIGKIRYLLREGNKIRVVTKDFEYFVERIGEYGLKMKLFKLCKQLIALQKAVKQFDEDKENIEDNLDDMSLEELIEFKKQLDTYKEQIIKNKLRRNS